MTKKFSQQLVQQVRQNAVALISLTIAIASLGYNSWRNETTETQRNTREAAFEMVSVLADLQHNLFLQRYSDDEESWHRAWASVISLETLASILPESVAAKTASLRQIWQDNGGQLRDETAATADDAERRINEAIDALNQSLIEEIRRLS